MPGIFGFTHSSSDRQREQRLDGRLDSRIAEMQRLLTHASTYRCDATYADANIAAGRTSVGIVNPVPQPATFADRMVWMEGELLGPSPSDASEQGDAPDSDAQRIARLVANDPEFKFLTQLNGVFAAVIYDRKSSQLHFITDRHGLEFLYLVEHRDGLVWSSEIKGFLGDDAFRPEIDEQSVEEFVRQGHLSDDRTWFRDAKLIPPASHWTWDLRSKRWADKHQYWSWEEWTPLSPTHGIAELAEESARLFRQAVARCDDRPNHRVGLLLSGGMDSRAILAALDPREEPITSVTFGLPTSSDLAIAKRVAGLAGAHHVFRPITANDWTNHREEFVWYLDGHLDLQHLHYSTCAPQTRQLYDVNLSGYLGDATIGGSYLNVGSQSESSRILNRGRRFIAYGVQQGKIFSHERMPFFENGFLEHAMRVPAELRANSRFYFQMLKFLMPPHFHAIPWQASGLAIHWPSSIHSFSQLRKKVTRRAARALGIDSMNREYHDYPGWFGSPKGRSLIQNYLLSTDSCCASLKFFEQRDELLRVAAKPVFSPVDVNFLGRVLTLEIWLRQLNDPQRRPRLAEMNS